MSFPKDCSARKIGSRGRQLVHSLIDTDHWEYHEESGNDFFAIALLNYLKMVNGETISLKDR